MNKVHIHVTHNCDECCKEHSPVADHCLSLSFKSGHPVSVAKYMRDKTFHPDCPLDDDPRDVMEARIDILRVNLEDRDREIYRLKEKIKALEDFYCGVD